MSKKLFPWILLLGMAVPLGWGGDAQNLLPHRYKQWLEEEVSYIITDRERSSFLKLGTDRERDIFIEAFWKQRDPTPGTPENEFKNEHYRRLAYANKVYGRGTPRPGWMTDQGRTYIVLGEPRNVERYDNVNGVNPTEIWFYQSDPSSGLPPGFNLIFFKREGMGEYILYSPVDHGPEALIADPLADFRTASDALRRLQQLAPTLAWQTLSLIPGENTRMGETSLASNALLKNIFASPLKKVDDAYAEALLKYKDIVEVESTASYIGLEARTQVVQDEGGYFLVHYSVEPQKLSLEKYEDRYTANFDLNGRLSDASNRTVYQFDRKFGVSLDASELEQVRGTSLALQDAFPVLPGRYKFDLLVKNTVSKEFGVYETELTVPTLPSPGPVLGSPLLAYDVQAVSAAPGEEMPFRLAGRQALCEARNAFVPGDTLHAVFQVYGLPANWDEAARIRLEYIKDGQTFLTRNVKPAEIKTGETFIESQALTEFRAGYYDLKISLLDPAGREVQSQSAHFTVSLVPRLPRPRILAKVFRPENKAGWDYALGLQSLNIGAVEQAQAYLGKALAQKPGEAAFALSYAQSLYILKDYPKAEQVLLPLLKQDQVEPDVYSWLGRTSHAQRRYREAIGYYQEYLSRAGTNLEVLNLVGSCYFDLGDKAAALATWRKSLAINPNQEELRKLVEAQSKK